MRLRLGAPPDVPGEGQQELGSKISDLGSSSRAVREPSGLCTLLQTTVTAGSRKRGSEYLAHRVGTHRVGTPYVGNGRKDHWTGLHRHVRDVP